MSARASSKSTVEATAALAPPRPDVAVSLRAVSKVYGRNRTTVRALNAVSINLLRGSFTARRRCDRGGDARTHGERDDRNGDAIHSARWLGGRRRRHGAVSRSSDDAARATGAADAAGRGYRYPRMSFGDSSLTTEDSSEAATPTARHRRDHPGRRRALPQLLTLEVRTVSQVGQALVWLVIGRHERVQQPRVVGRRTVLHRTCTGWL
jgi:hypothetical protein